MAVAAGPWDEEEQWLARTKAAEDAAMHASAAAAPDDEADFGEEDDEDDFLDEEEAEWEVKVREQYPELSVGNGGPPFSSISHMLQDVSKLRTAPPAALPLTPMDDLDLDDFVFTMESRHGARPTQWWIGLLDVENTSASADYTYEAGGLLYDVDDAAPLVLRLYVTTPDLQTVKLYEGALHHDSLVDVEEAETPVAFFERKELPYAHAADYALTLKPALCDFTAVLLQFKLVDDTSAEDALPPHAVLDYLCGLPLAVSAPVETIDEDEPGRPTRVPAGDE